MAFFSSFPRTLLTSAIAGSALLSVIPAAIAQSVVPAQDGFNTQVELNGSTYTITGGTASDDGGNLFHSLEQLNLTVDETAVFSNSADVQNVIGRITNGQVSNIDGLLEISNGSANLFLLNPAGFLFGENATLNLPAAFTASTASSIGFESGLFDLNSVAAVELTGAPTDFTFTSSDGGTIVNAGDLAVGEGQSLSLFGDRVVNVGTLSAPGGSITVAAIVGEGRVRLSSAGQLLSIEVPESTTSLAELPDLLTGGMLASADGFVQNADGSIELTASGVAVPNVSGIAAVSGTLSTAGEQGGSVQVFGEQVALVDATIDASGARAGGTVAVGGGYQGEGPLSALRTFVDASSAIDSSATVSGDAGQTVVWADGLTEFYGAIAATGGATSGDGGFVEVSGADSLVFDGTVDTSAANGDFGTLLLDPKNIAIVGDGSPADGDDEGDRANALGASPLAPSYTLPASAAPTGGTFQIFESELEGMSGATNITLQATNNITVNDLPDDELLFQPGTGAITFTADADGDGVGAFLMNGITDTIRAAGRNVTISGFSANIATIDTSFTGAGGDISVVSSGGNIQVAGGLVTDAARGGLAGNINLEVTQDLGSIIANSSGVTLSAVSETGNGGNVNLSTAGGSIRTLDVTTQSEGAGAAGDITFDIASNSEGIGQIDTSGGTLRASSANGSGGNVSLTTAAGNIDTSDIVTDASSTGNAGSITARINGGQGSIDTTAGSLQATASSGNGGDISLTTNRGNISVSDMTTTASASSATGGDISLTVEANAGSINATTGSLVSGNGDGDGGNISLETRNGSISASNLDASSTASGTGGDISATVNRGSGSIDLSSAEITTGSASGDAGDVTFEAARGSIQSRGIDAASGGSGQGGDVTYTTNPNGNINTTNGSGSTLDVSSASGRGGNVELSSGLTNVASVNANGSRGGFIQFLSDETNIADGALVQANGGRVQFATLKPGRRIRVGGNSDSSGNVLDVTREDISRLGGDFRYIVIGERGNTGKIRVVPGTQFPARVQYRQRRAR